MSETQPPKEPANQQDNGSREGSGEDAGSKNADRMSIAALIVSIAGLLVAIVSSDFRAKIASAILAIIIAVAFTPLVWRRLRKFKYVTHAYALLCAALALCLYATVASRHPVPVETAPASDASTTQPTIRIENPLPNSPVGQCITVSGEARLSEGDSIWILVQGQSPTLYYLEGATHPSATPGAGGWVGWTYNPAKIGSPNSSAKYNIYALVVNPTVNNFLAELENTLPIKNGSTTIAPFNDDANTQADQNLPPMLADKPVTVTRIPNDIGDCG